MGGRADGQQQSGRFGPAVQSGGAEQRSGAAQAEISGQSLLTALFNQQATGMAEIDLDAGKVVRCNPYLVRLLGFPADDRRAGQLVMLAGAESGDAVRGPDTQLKRHDGSFVRVRLARLALSPGRALLMVSPDDGGCEAGHAARDYREIYDNVSEGIYRSSIDGRQVSANPALVRLNGYSSEAEMLAAVNDIATEWYVDPNRRDEFRRILHEHGRVENFVSEIHRHKTRERIWISENARLVRDERTGEPLYYEGSIRDVTETVRRLQLELRLRTIIETIADGVITTNAEGAIQTVNRAAEAMFGWQAADLVGRPFSTLLTLPRGERLDAGGESEWRVEAWRRDGSSFVIDVAVAEAADAAGPMLIYCMRDATVRLRYEEGLREAKEAAERANRAKSDFLAMMSHELRTPLNAVIGMSGLLLDGTLDEQARRHAETLRDAADQLMQVINDVLDFSKLDAGRLEFEEIPFEIDTVVHSALDLLAPRAHAKGLELAAYVAPDVPAHFSGDPGRLRQVLINLIGNAIKFTEHGAVSVEVERLSDGPEANRGEANLDEPASSEQPGEPADQMVALVIAVRDTGIGISSDRLPHLFKEFSQLDSSVARRFGGSGLGLAISSRLVAGMGGTITANSQPGDGSTFRFTLRLRELRGGPMPRPPERLDGGRVLVVDDNAINLGIFARQLEARGAQVVAVAEPSQALNALQTAAAEGAAFAAAVIDHLMPGIDGEALGRSIRQDPAVPALRLVLATSSMVGIGARVGAERVFDQVLTKPVPVDVLVRALRGAPAPQPRRTAVEPPAASPGPRPVRVLVAEDNPTNQLVIRAMIERLGHRADVVGNGLEAVQAVQARAYDMVLMDVMMPGMDGMEATRRIRAMAPPLSAIPVLGLTAHISPQDHADFRAAGMDSVITKPVTAKALAAALAPVVQTLAPAEG
jgi:PAS domain S-box-containing protein